MSAKKFAINSLQIVLAFLALNVAVSTAWYNYADRGLDRIRDRFVEQSVYELNCIPPEMAEDGHYYGSYSLIGCALTERDQYLGERHVARWGGWWLGSFPRGNWTFAWYFTTGI